MLDASYLERRVLACSTCHQSYGVCPECGGRRLYKPPYEIVCKVCEVEIVKVGEHNTPGEMMGFEGSYTSPVYQCPNCKVQWCSATHEQPETVYVKEF